MKRTLALLALGPLCLGLPHGVFGQSLGNAGTIDGTVVDPSGASGEEDLGADEIGIVAAAIGVDGHVYILSDRTGLFSPEGWGRESVLEYLEREGDCIVAESNYGGDMEIASQASLLSDDFEVVLFEGSNPLRYAAYMTAVTLRQVKSMPGVRSVRAQRVEFSGSAHLQIDGEYAGRLPASLEMTPDALTLLIPPTYR